VRVRTLSSAFFCSLTILAILATPALARANSGPTLSQKHTLAVVALLGIVALWAAAMVIGLTFCRAAAAGDRMVDGERTAGLRAEPELPTPRWSGPTGNASARELPVRANQPRPPRA
jgi:hypothetical protein